MSAVPFLCMICLFFSQPGGAGQTEEDQSSSLVSTQPPSTVAPVTERGGRGGYTETERAPWPKKTPVLPSAVLEEKREVIPEPGGLGLLSGLCIAVACVIIIALVAYIATQTGLLVTLWRRLH